MCWYVNWSEQRDQRPYSPDFINYDLCSHILYSAALINPKTLSIGFMQQNISVKLITFNEIKIIWFLFIKENLEKILNSKLKYEHLKVILVVGSYDTKSYGFDSVTNPNNTKVIEFF